MLIVPYLAEPDWTRSFDALSAQTLEQISWEAFPYLPHVEFKIAHQSSHILLEFKVKEQELKARYTRTNDPVYTDSCVEFFLSFDGTHYYNMEFNSLGTALVGYGRNDKSMRTRLPNPLIETIESVKDYQNAPDKNGDISWSLRLRIPKTLFCYHPALTLEGTRAKANFYKCGDDLKVPHFVSWKKIETSEPDFHQPRFFGEIEFQQARKS